MTEYSKEKQEYIKSLPIYEIMDYVSQITGKYRGCLNKAYLNDFVNEKYKNLKDDSIKYGPETKRNFCELLKNGEFSNKKRKRLLKEDDFSTLLITLNLFWTESNFELHQFIIYENKEEEEKKEIDYIASLNNFIQENKKNNTISKESIRTFYQFSPIDLNNDIEKQINNCKSRLEIIPKIKSKNDKEIDNLKRKKSEIEQEKSKNDDIVKDLNEKNEKLEKDIQLKTACINQLNDEINQEKEHSFELQTKLDIAEKNSNKNYDLEKVKENFQKQLKDKDIIIEDLQAKIKESEHIYSKNEELLNEVISLRKIKEFNLREFKNKISNDISFQDDLKRLILSDESTYKLVIRLLNLKEEILKEAHKIYEQECIDDKLEIEQLEKQIDILKLEIESLQKEKNDVSKNAIMTTILSSMQFEDEDLFKLPSENQSKPLMFINENQFDREVRLVLEDKGDKYINSLLYKFKKEKFIIVDDEDDILALINTQRYNFESLYIFPEYDWTSINDWFGYFDNGKFIPSKTKIADYCKFVKDENLPLGVVVFYDFNKILPDMYLEPFIQNININEGMDLIHPNAIVNDNSVDFKRIEISNSLKFVFVKSKSQNAFDIPYSMKKYEVISD